MYVQTTRGHINHGQCYVLAWRHCQDPVISSTDTVRSPLYTHSPQCICIYIHVHTCTHVYICCDMNGHIHVHMRYKVSYFIDKTHSGLNFHVIVSV